MLVHGGFGRFWYGVARTGEVWRRQDGLAWRSWNGRESIGESWHGTLWLCGQDVLMSGTAR